MTAEFRTDTPWVTLTRPRPHLTLVPDSPEPATEEELYAAIFDLERAASTLGERSEDSIEERLYAQAVYAEHWFDTAPRADSFHAHVASFVHPEAVQILREHGFRIHADNALECALRAFAEVSVSELVRLVERLCAATEVTQ